MTGSRTIASEKWLAILLGVWVYFFLVLIGPFDVGPMSMFWRVMLMSGYGVIFSISYLLTNYAMYKVRQEHGSTSLNYEASFVLLFVLLNCPLTYAYYRSGIVQGDYGLWEFLSRAYFTSLTIIIPIMLLGRWVIRRKNTPNDRKFNFRGANGLDFLQLDLNDLILVSSFQNYVEFYFERNGRTEKKLIRSTLKRVQKEIPELTQVHRSHLVNLDHVTSWDGRSTLTLSTNSIPVSESFKGTLLKKMRISPLQ